MSLMNPIYRAGGIRTSTLTSSSTRSIQKTYNRAFSLTKVAYSQITLQSCLLLQKRPSRNLKGIHREHNFAHPVRNHNSTPKIKAIQDDMASTTQEKYSAVFDSNLQWARSLKSSQPELFEKLGKGQSPEILWIGCADSRCPETTILGFQPGDVFCHRNIANILTSTDLNSLSVIQYAVQYLKVKHIIVCGHTSCGGVAAALDNKALGLIDTWLTPLRTLRQQNIKMLEAMEPKEAGLKLVDLNVRRSVGVLLENPIVIDAMVERNLKVHGIIYNVGNGELKELDIKEEDALVEERKKAHHTK